MPLSLLRQWRFEPGFESVIKFFLIWLSGFCVSAHWETCSITFGGPSEISGVSSPALFLCRAGEIPLNSKIVLQRRHRRLQPASPLGKLGPTSCLSGWCTFVSGLSEGGTPLNFQSMTKTVTTVVVSVIGGSFR